MKKFEKYICINKTIVLILIGLIGFTKSHAEKVEGTLVYSNDSVAQVIFDIPIKPLIGEVKYLELQERIVFYNSVNKRIKLTPDKVKEIRFRFNNEDIRLISVVDVPYKFPLDNPSRHVILPIIIEGSLSLLIYHSDIGPVGMYVGPGSKWRGKSGDVELIVLKKNNGKLYKPRFTDKNFKNDMKLYLSDCPSLIQKIENDLYTIDNIRQMVVDYNTNCVKKE